MKLATTPDEQRRWMEQWRRTAVALAEMKRYDLQTLTEEKAWEQIEAIQSLRDIWRDPEKPPGLVAQQALFGKLHRALHHRAGSTAAVRKPRLGVLHHWRRGVQRWGEPRLTRAVDLTLLTGSGAEEKFIETWLRDYKFRPSGSREMALNNRVLLLVNQRGTPADVALGGIDFERRSIQRSSLWKTPAGAIRTCSAEDLLVHK